MSARTLLLGHRGLRIPGGPRENTLAAFDLCLEQGCGGFEFDVRLTADGRTVICHDPGSGRKDISQTKSAELPDLCSLDDVLERFSKVAFLDIELKVRGLETIVQANLRRNPPERGFVVSSFLPEVINELGRQDSSLPLGLICETLEQLSRWQDLPVGYVFTQHALADQSLIGKVQSAGKKVMAWTVNDEEKMRRLSGWNIDGIISDDPALLVKTMREA